MRWQYLKQTRFWIIGLIFLAAYCNISNLNSTKYIIPAMIYSTKNHRVVPLCYRNTERANISIDRNKFATGNYGPRYNWTKNAIEDIKFSSYYGYLGASIPAGFVLAWLGPFNCIFYPMLFQGIFISFGAIGAGWHWTCLYLGCLLKGITGALVIPALMALIAQWSPRHERGIFVAGLSGRFMGMSLSAVLFQNMIPTMGWFWAFQICAFKNFIFCVLFWFFASDLPETHKWISQDELDYISRSRLGLTVGNPKKLPAFGRMFNSGPVWSCFVLSFASYWGNIIDSHVIPRFIETVIGLDSERSVYIYTIPHVFRIFFAFVFAYLSDFFENRDILSATACIKVLVFASHILPAFSTAAMGHVNCNLIGATFMVLLTTSLMGANTATSLKNPLDLTPNYVGMLAAFCQFVNMTSSFAVIYLSRALRASRIGIFEWLINYLIAGGVYFASALIFLFFGSAEIESWNFTRFFF